jgi:glycosyltransferase involved in cell wall biosynthesis
VDALASIGHLQLHAELVLSHGLTIVQVCTPGRVGGIERVVQLLAIGLEAAHNRVTVLPIFSHGIDIAPFIDPLEHAGVDVRPVRIARFSPFKEMKDVDKVIRDVAPDVVHFHGYRADILHSARARRSGFPTVVSVHSAHRETGRMRVYRWIWERRLGLSDAVVAVSRPVASELSTVVSRDRLHTILNGYAPGTEALGRTEARRALRIDEGRPTIGWIGRLEDVKDPLGFLEALASIQDQDWQAVVIGDGPQSGAVRARRDALGLGSRVKTLGEIPNASRYLPAFDPVDAHFEVRRQPDGRA